MSVVVVVAVFVVVVLDKYCYHDENYQIEVKKRKGEVSKGKDLLIKRG